MLKLLAATLTRREEFRADAGAARLTGRPLALARALYRLDLDTEIPAEYYKAVAEIIAYVWRLRRHVRAVS